MSVCWEKSAGGARAGTCAGKAPGTGNRVGGELAGCKPAALCSLKGSMWLSQEHIYCPCHHDPAPSSYHTECAQGMKGSRTALGSPANAPGPSSVICSQDGELAMWHNLTSSWGKPKMPQFC